MRYDLRIRAQTDDIFDDLSVENWIRARIVFLARTRSFASLLTHLSLAFFFLRSTAHSHPNNRESRWARYRETNRARVFDGNPSGNDRGGLRRVTLGSSFIPKYRRCIGGATFHHAYDRAWLFGNWYFVITADDTRVRAIHLRVSTTNGRTLLLAFPPSIVDSR